MSSSERLFVVDIEPVRPGRWEVWISEEPYRGAITDSDLPGERQRIGSTWTDRWLVGRWATERAARSKGRKALAQAENKAAARRAFGEAHRRFCDAHQPIRLTSGGDR